MAGILHEFVQNTKILASKVNENFATVQNDMEEIGSGLNTALTNAITAAKNDLLEDIESVSNGKASLDLANINANGKANVIDWLAPNYDAGYSVSSDWTAPKAGWVACYGTSGEGSYSAWNIDGKEVFRDDQSWGGGRAGGQGSRAMAFIRKGQVLTKSGQADGSAIFYPCIGN